MTLSSASIFNSYNTSNKNATTSGNCISRIIRRILCITNLPKSSFDHFKDGEAKDPLLECASATPSLMARLMGLDSLPSNESNQSTPSTNHVETNRKSRSPRTRKISPTYREFEDENFFILSFDRGENLDITGERWRSSCSRSGKKYKQRRRRDVNKENFHRISVSGKELDCETKSSEFRKKDSSNVLRPLQNSTKNSKEASEKQRKGRRHGSKVEELKTELDSENSSPNSVLDFLEVPPDKEAPTPENESRLENSKLRRTLSAELGNVTSSSDEKRSNKDGCVEEQKHKRLRDSKEHYAEKLGEISKLAAKALVESSWLNNETLKNHHFEMIGKQLSLDIFDQLLHELLV